VDEFESRLSGAIRVAGESVLLPESLPAHVMQRATRLARARVVRTVSTLSLVFVVTAASLGAVIASQQRSSGQPSVAVGSFTDDPTMSGVLQSVACISPTECLAGGLTPGAKSLAAVAQDSHWIAQRTPNPKGAEYVLVNGVSCAGPSACMAVGISTPQRPKTPTTKPWTLVVPQPLAEWWNGETWTLLHVPLPGMHSGWLNSVSCTAENRCVAVGSASLLETWNGTTWTAQQLPGRTPAGIDYYGISCPTASSCVAVGRRQQLDGTVASESAVLADGRWRMTSLASAALNSVSCSTSTNCAAIGYLEGHDAGPLPGVHVAPVVPLIEDWNGQEWSRASLPSSFSLAEPLVGTSIMGGVAGYTNGLQALSCTSSSCVAVGFDGTGPLALVRTNGTWRNVSVPGARANGSVFPHARAMGTFLLSVSCSTPTSCTAVGFAGSTNSATSADAAIAERWNGQRWVVTLQAPPTMVNCDLASGSSAVTTDAPSSAAAGAVSAQSVEDAMVSYRGDPMTATLVYLTLPRTSGDRPGSAPGSGPPSGAVTNLLAWQIIVTIPPTLMPIEGYMPPGAIENPATCTYTHVIAYADANTGHGIYSTEAQ
jgi:hypothetical protein